MTGLTQGADWGKTVGSVPADKCKCIRARNIPVPVPRESPMNRGLRFWKNEKYTSPAALLRLLPEPGSW
eukprot:scaffold19525_cov26-Tisochrysis_lutea.AAC.4